MKQFATFEEHIASVERYLSGADERKVRDLLRARGFKVTKSKGLSDADVRTALRALIDALAAERIYLDCTDHLSDRALYEAIVRHVVPNSYSVGGGDFAVHDFSEAYSEETFATFLTYYASDKERAWAVQDGMGPVPEKRALPFDRDRTLPRPADWNEVYG